LTGFKNGESGLKRILNEWGECRYVLDTHMLQHPDARTELGSRNDPPPSAPPPIFQETGNSPSPIAHRISRPPSRKQRSLAQAALPRLTRLTAYWSVRRSVGLVGDRTFVAWDRQLLDG
jgi:hypothetical protein